FQERLEILGIVFLAGHELPVDRAEPVAQFVHALTDKTLDRFAGTSELAAIGAVARRLHCEDEARRGLAAPLRPAVGFEGRVIGAVDLDRSEMLAGIFELALLRQAFRVEDAAPRLEGPAADADINLAAHVMRLSFPAIYRKFAAYSSRMSMPKIRRLHDALRRGP